MIAPIGPRSRAASAPRFHCPTPLASGGTLALPAGAARHVQVLRLQPGDSITLFDGLGGEYMATVERMGRSEVEVHIGAHAAIEREARTAVHLAVGMPANERMDWLVEKATELGAASIQPLITAHSVLRLAGERAEKKRAHWEAIAVAACEQCGRNRVPRIHPMQGFTAWMQQERSSDVARWILSLAPDAQEVGRIMAPADPTPPQLILSGPEGGLSADEEQQAIIGGFRPLTLGPRVLRAETAALVALVHFATL